VRPALGPDATGVGWIYQYVVQGKERTLDELRTLQDWFLRYQLTTTEGVSEIASVGGFVKTYQITVDPRRLQAYNIPLKRITEVIAASNRDVGGRVIELTETEYMVRGRGYLRGIADLENLVVNAHQGMPVLLRDVARVELAPSERRGITELNGEGEAVSGIAVARYGENALDVIHNLEQKLEQIRTGLPGQRIGGIGVQPLGTDSSRHRNVARSVHRTNRHHRAGVRNFSDACAQRPGRDHHAADRRIDCVHRDDVSGHQFEYHEPGRYRAGNCGNDRRRDRDGGKRTQASGARRAGGIARSRSDRLMPGSRTIAVFQPADHHRVVSAGVCAGSTGRPHVPTARVYQNLCHGGRGGIVDHAGAGIDLAADPRAHSARGR
jgi:hypothetical protein